MGFKDFLYRQHQRIQYHTCHDLTTKRIAEINRFKKIIESSGEGHRVPVLNVVLPLNEFDFIFQDSTFELFFTLPAKLLGHYQIADNRLFLCFADLKLEITSRSELYIINEVYFERCYHFLLPYNEMVHVIDIGMNVGIASLFFAGLAQVKQVHSYEPFS